MIIPYQELAEETLYNLLESYALREGTDYGESEISLTSKVEQLLLQLKSGELLLVWSELHESVNLMTKQEIKQLETVQAPAPPDF
ncbi:YheU family protein [Corallincola platygyrae]|uniref:YheU family protein n=1 Tax=Corallincola platygyrae TaxID=1193278 RepID=A0ABW4XQU1_9GAMM